MATQMSYARLIYKMRVGTSVLDCIVNETADQYLTGLQKTRGLTDKQGMFFPYENKMVTFHMGTVSFPIDIIFIRDGAIAKIIGNVQPGARGLWSLENCMGVLETRGGWCADHGANIGTKVRWV